MKPVKKKWLEVVEWAMRKRSKLERLVAERATRFTGFAKVVFRFVTDCSQGRVLLPTLILSYVSFSQEVAMYLL